MSSLFDSNGFLSSSFVCWPGLPLIADADMAGISHLILSSPVFWMGLIMFSSTPGPRSCPSPRFFHPMVQIDPRNPAKFLFLNLNVFVVPAFGKPFSSKTLTACEKKRYICSVCRDPKTKRTKRKRKKTNERRTLHHHLQRLRIV